MSFSRNRFVLPSLFVALLFCCVTAGSADAQQQDFGARSSAKAFAYSLALPGAGHWYANDNNWRGAATAHAIADVALWVSVISTERGRQQHEDSFRLLASASANADVDGKNRRFFLNLATFRSSEEYLEVQLRNRAWDQLDYVSDASFQWEWNTESDFQTFRALRNDAESLKRRKSVIVAGLVGNRLISGILAARSAKRSRSTVDVAIRLVPSSRSEIPGLYAALRW